MRMALIGAAAVALNFSSQAVAETPRENGEPAFANAIVAQALPIERDGAGAYSGPGWRALLDAAAPAQFFMAGEQHGSAAIAQFEVALQNTLMRTGFTHTAFEIGPLSTLEAERMERARAGALAIYLAEPGHGFTVPFLFVREEMPLLTQAIALSPDHQHAAWGLDQEFVGAAPLLAQVMRRAAATPAQRAAVERYATAAATQPFFLPLGPDEDLAAIESAFADNPEIVRIIADVRASRAIYAPFMGSGGSIYPANLARETMMKRNFQRQFEDAEARLGAPPRVFLKFGASHAMRGHSLTDVPALGNFLSEWGGSRGLRYVNVVIDCDGGEALNPQTSLPEPCESITQDAPALAAAVHAGPPMQVINLAALRPQLGTRKDIDPETRRLILGFDYYVAIRGGTASSPIGTFPK